MISPKKYMNVLRTLVAILCTINYTIRYGMQSIWLSECNDEVEYIFVSEKGLIGKHKALSII